MLAQERESVSCEVSTSEWGAAAFEKGRVRQVP